MTLDEILKEQTAWLDQQARQPLFDKVTDKDLTFPQDLRDRRAAEIAATIDALTKRRDEAVALYEAAIEGYKKELDTIKSAPAPTAGTTSVPTGGTIETPAKPGRAATKKKPR